MFYGQVWARIGADHFCFDLFFSNIAICDARRTKKLENCHHLTISEEILHSEVLH